MVDPPIRYAIWAVSLCLEFATPTLNRRATRFIPIDLAHIPERFGLFTIIVLGEAVIATANGARTVDWDLPTVVVASMGFAMAAAIWWINFDFVEDSAVRSNSLARRFAYLYGHLFIVASIVVIGVGVEHSIKEVHEAHLHLPTLFFMAGGISVYLLVITLVRMLTGYCSLIYVRIAAAGVSASTIIIGQFISPLPAVALLVGVLVINIVIEARFSTEKEKDDDAEIRPCGHADEILVNVPRTNDGCEECRKNNYKWVHLRLCLTCGHVGCCDTSKHKHATKHFNEEGHPIIASLEPGENWAWCYVDEKFVPGPR
jgi:low temperature requirement protein LtrA